VVDHGGGGQVTLPGASQSHRLVQDGLGVGDQAHGHVRVRELDEDGQPQVAGQVGPSEKFLVTGDAGLVVAGGDQGPAQVEDQLGRRGRPGQVDGRLQVAACRAHGADRQRLPAGVGRDRHGLRVPRELGRHRVPCRLARVVRAGRQHPERGLVQARLDRGGQLVDGLANQLVAELGPAADLVAASPEAATASCAAAASAAASPATCAATSGRNRRPSTAAARRYPRVGSLRPATLPVPDRAGPGGGLLLLPSFFSDRCVRLLSCSSASADLAVNVWHGPATLLGTAGWPRASTTRAIAASQAARRQSRASPAWSFGSRRRIRWGDTAGSTAN
jgi:hypothetical protein